MFGLQVGEELKGQKPDVKREIWDQTQISRVIALSLWIFS